MDYIIYQKKIVYLYPFSFKLLIVPHVMGGVGGGGSSMEREKSARGRSVWCDGLYTGGSWGPHS